MSNQQFKLIKNLPIDVKNIIYMYCLDSNPIANIMKSYFSRMNLINRFNFHIKINPCDIYRIDNNYIKRINFKHNIYDDYNDIHMLNLFEELSYEYEICYYQLKVDHDGYDSFGPESNLYYLTVYLKKDYNFYKKYFYRDYYYQGSDNMKFQSNDN